MKNVKKALKRSKVNIIEYIITNRLFLSYVVLSLVVTMLTRKFTIGTFFAFKPMITDLGLILIIGALGYLIKSKNQFKYYFSWLIFFSFLGLLSTIYYRFFTSFASVGEFAALGQTETVTGSIFDRLYLKDALFIAIPFLFFIIHKKLSETTYYYFVSKLENSKKMFATTLLVGVICTGYSFGIATGTDYSRLTKQWNRPYIVKRFGIITYQTNDLIQFLSTKINSLFGYDSAESLFNEYFSEKEATAKNQYTGILKGKNIVFVHMESMQTFLMDLEFNGEEVTPNLNKLATEGMFFKNFYPQVSTGTSSDSEFTLLTGLTPAASGTVFVGYYDRNYFTIPKFLSNEGYYTFSMHGNLPSMWNRSKAHPSLGYQDMYFKDSFDFTDDDVINLGINDKLFFEQGIQIMENIESENKNYMGEVITLSNHSPFKLASSYSTLDLTSYVTDPETGEVTGTDYLSSSSVGEYIKSANYADQALGEFLDYINNSDYFNNTVFVFYGDHDAKLSRSEINYLYNLNPNTGNLYTEGDENYVNYDYYAHELNKKTPLIIWTKNSKLKNVFTGTVEYYTGMYNVAPTILNMFGLYNKYSVGEDIFSVKNDNFIVFPSGNILNNKIYYNNSTDEYKNLTDEEMDMDYIMNLLELGEKRLEVSNSIIVYNLLKDEQIDGE